MGQIAKLQKEIHQYAKSKGFWDAPRNPSEMLMLIVTELSEACEALRKDNRQPHYNNKLRNKDWIKDSFEDEIADAVIRILDLAEGMGIDLEWQIKQKMSYNQTRPYKHGKKF